MQVSNSDYRGSIALSASPVERQGSFKPERVPRHQSFGGDGSSSYASESSNTVFPELQQLPKEAKLPIRHFLQEGILSFQRENEDVPRKMRLLTEATEKVDDEEEDDEEGDAEIEVGRGPYGTILHTASAVGNYWLVEIQIKAGVDVTAFDDHSWTALMVAEAQGHTTCANLLSEHMETIGAHTPPEALPPSGLVKADPKTSIQIGPDNLTATPGSWHALWLQRRVQIRSNHPIPPDSPNFYYEITILDNGPLGYVHSSVIELLDTNKNLSVSSSSAF